MRNLLLSVVFFAFLATGGCASSNPYLVTKQREEKVDNARELYYAAMNNGKQQQYLISLLIKYLEDNRINANEIEPYLTIRRLEELTKTFTPPIEPAPQKFMLVEK